MYSSINGEIFKDREAKLLLADLAIQRGYGIFDFFRTEDGQPLYLSDHLDRFYSSASQMYLEPVVDRGTLTQMITELMEKNGLENSGVKIILTGGLSTDGYTLEGPPNLLITQAPFKLDTAAFNSGMSVVTSDHQRQLPGIKTLDYLMAIYLQPFIKANNADDVLYFHNDEVTECPRANFFMVNQEGELITAKHNILKGVTRKRILAIDGLNCREAIITLADLEAAKEAFISSTTKIAMPVLEINGKAVGDGKPGAITRYVHEKLLHKKEHPASLLQSSGS